MVTPSISHAEVTRLLLLSRTAIRFRGVQSWLWIGGPARAALALANVCTFSEQMKLGPASAEAASR